MDNSICCTLLLLLGFAFVAFLDYTIHRRELMSANISFLETGGLFLAAMVMSSMLYIFMKMLNICVEINEHLEFDSSTLLRTATNLRLHADAKEDKDARRDLETAELLMLLEQKVQRFDDTMKLMGVEVTKKFVFGVYSSLGALCASELWAVIYPLMKNIDVDKLEKKIESGEW